MHSGMIVVSVEVNRKKSRNAFITGLQLAAWHSVSRRSYVDHFFFPVFLIPRGLNF